MFPLVASTTVWPGLSLPLLSASSIIFTASRSLTDEAGLKNSAFTKRFIPLGAKHRLSNPGKINLTLIEVQSGDYLGEDDIIRFKDEYGRNPLNNE